LRLPQLEILEHSDKNNNENGENSAKHRLSKSSWSGCSKTRSWGKKDRNDSENGENVGKNKLPKSGCVWYNPRFGIPKDKSRTETEWKLTQKTQKQVAAAATRVFGTNRQKKYSHRLLGLAIPYMRVYTCA